MIFGRHIFIGLVTLFFMLTTASHGLTADCTNKAPVDCYTDGLSQVEAALGRVKELDAQIQKFRSEIDALARIAAPSGGVLAFALGVCPEGWSKYDPAIGRFVRGIDPTNGNRKIGSLEEDAFQTHTFGDGDNRFLRWSPNHTTKDPPNGYSSMQTTGIFGANPDFGATTDARIVADGSAAVPRVADETRPKNVGLLYCKRN
jgi:hypothetical protein